jgi:hypothetical protein
VDDERVVDIPPGVKSSERTDGFFFPTDGHEPSRPFPRWFDQFQIPPNTDGHSQTQLDLPRRLGQQEDHTGQRYTREQLQTQGQPPLEDGPALSDLTSVDDERGDQGSDSEEELLQGRKLSSSRGVGCVCLVDLSTDSRDTRRIIQGSDSPISVW